MRTVLTGGTGVIGRAAVVSLRRAGHDVAVVTRSPRADRVAASLDVPTLRGDVLDRAALRAAFEGADVVVNLAGRTPVGHSAKTPARGATRTCCGPRAWPTSCTRPARPAYAAWCRRA